MGQALENRPIGVIGNDEFGSAIAERIAACHFHTMYVGLAGAPFVTYGKMLERANEASIATECPIVLAAIEDTETFRHLLVGEGDHQPPVTSGPRRGTILVDLGARTPREFQALVEILEQRDVTLVDAALIGGPDATAHGHAKILLGGDLTAVEIAESVLSLLGNVERTGPLGSAHAAAALMGYVEAAHAVAREEALALGSACGLSPETLQRVLSSETSPRELNVVQLARRAALARRIARDRHGSADIINLAAEKNARKRENR
ncbi:NAD(P)-binding domain-containing protein [Hyphomicrobium sp.]|uniref:NAD(P)-binding domain-containing protein n=1 Tax=Hyphomicrobium sp. TaxID=82 RepID=UPI000F92E70C|nr:NAD(P)-binding domain-containing protein [Hyphomicrobium sp.]RUP09265.1 MAG: NAD(P)-dependent oxidoreductase [Hyphomicrobium sp.]